jgi:hypothetical protein
MGEDNFADVDQDGTTNKARVYQGHNGDDADFSESMIDQVGLENVATIRIEGESGSSTSSNNYGDIVQNGEYNLADLIQAGDDHDAWLDQSGIENTAKVSQTGDLHDAMVTQSGFNNLADVVQSGASHNATITQN